MEQVTFRALAGSEPAVGGCWVPGVRGGERRGEEERCLWKANKQKDQGGQVCRFFWAHSPPAKTTNFKAQGRGLKQSKDLDQTKHVI